MKIVWLTDAQAPYREPLWRELSAAVEFEASFVFREEKVRHWVWRDSPSYRSFVADAWTVPLPGPVARRLDSPMAWLKPGSANRILRGADALIIQNWWQPANIWCAWLGRRRDIPYMMYAESTLTSRRFARGPLAWLRCLLFRNAGAVIVPGPAAGNAAMADGTPPHRIVESVNSIDLTKFDSRVRELRTGCAEDPEHRFVYVGQLIERKNVDTLIRGFAAHSAKSTLDIAGDGVEMDALVALTRELGVEERVRFHGYLEEPEIVELLSHMHTLVLPSTEEVFGFTALEAYVAGLQVIVSARAGIALNLADKRGTWIVEPTVEDVARALGEARDCWDGWLDDVDVDFASPQRAARDIVRAAHIARTP